jgi:hypothetical protein
MARSVLDGAWPSVYHLHLVVVLHARLSRDESWHELLSYPLGYCHDVGATPGVGPGLFGRTVVLGAVHIILDYVDLFVGRRAISLLLIDNWAVWADWNCRNVVFTRICEDCDRSVCAAFLCLIWAEL